MKYKIFLKKIINNVEIEIRKSNAYHRLLPNYLIIGAQKAGTTSLYKYLCQHPNILPAFRKEIHYFDLNYSKNLNWYKSFFPLRAKLNSNSHPIITGEASPQYIFHPHSLLRIKNDLPNIKIILLLRNPIYRTYSHYQHQKRVGRENLTFEKAIEQEENRTEGELDKMIRDENFNSHNYLMYSYVRRSIYYYQVKQLYNLFNSENYLIIQSEKFNTNPQYEYDKVLTFLNLDNFRLEVSKKYNVQNYPPIKEKTKKKLEEFFHPYNEKLFELIGERYDW